MLLRQIPNILTISRLILVIPFLYFLLNTEYRLAFYLFFIAGLTDGLDGFLARHFHWQSTLGSILDPLADKLLISLCFVSLGVLSILPIWLVVLVLLRDLSIVLGVVAWFWYIRRPLEFKPHRISKLNTVMQLGLIFLCLIELAFIQLPAYCLNIMIFITAATTVWSYIDYLWSGAKRAYSSPPQIK